MAVNYVSLSGKRYPTGWVDRPAAVAEVLGRMRRPVFGVEARASGIAGSGEGKVVLLHQALAKVFGSFPIHNQTIGDCVSHGFGTCVDVLKAVQIVSGAREKFEAETATEVIYAGSRVEVGKGQAGRGDGSIGAWAAECVQEIGTVTRAKHGSVDLTRYDGQRAKAWGMPRAGVPDDLEPIAREHPVKTTSLVRSYEEARDAIANGYPVPVCSGQGFTDKRDEKGFCKPKGSWPHCMALISVDDADGRPGILVMNSWGPGWVSGPKRHDQPDGSFWADAGVIDKMLREGDSFALSAFVGFPASRIDYSSL